MLQKDDLIMAKFDAGTMSATIDGIVSVLNESGEWRVVPQYLGSTGYPVVSLRIDGKSFIFSVHRLVWMCMYGSIPSHLVVNHKDMNKNNNRIDNLELLSIADNVRHGRKARRDNGEKFTGKNAKLTEEQIHELRHKYFTGTGSSILAEEYGVHQRTVSRIALCHGYNGVPLTHGERCLELKLRGYTRPDVLFK